MPYLSEKDTRNVQSIFASGVVVIVCWFLVLGILSFFENSSAPKMITMIVTHLLSGRAGGISVGLELEIPSWLIVVNATLIDSIIVLLLYPLFVFSFRHTIKKGVFRSIIDKSVEVAEANRNKVGKWGVIGLLLFVWFPLHMTGPLAGSILGFLIGMKPLRTIGIVISGTFFAVLSWLFVFRRAFEVTGDFSILIPITVVLFSILMVLIYHYKKKKHNKGELDEKE